MNSIKAVFLDRDGTIIEDKHYIMDPEQVSLMPNSAEGLFLLQSVGYRLIVVTNQSGIARGYFTVKDMELVNKKMCELLKDKGVTINKIYYCPHYDKDIPNGLYKKECTCRKPKPGMAYMARDELHIDLDQTYMIGDKISDIEFGKNAGCRGTILLANRRMDSSNHFASHISVDLLAAANWIINEEEGNENDKNISGYTFKQ